MILQETTNFLQARIKNVPEISEIVVGQGFTGVQLSDGNGGIAMNLWKGGEALPDNRSAFLQNCIGTGAFAAAADAAGTPDRISASVRVAVLNALSVPFMAPESLKQYGLAALDPDAAPIHRGITDSDTVTLVGFGGMVHGLARTAGRLYVSELDMARGRSLIYNRSGHQTGPANLTMVHARQAQTAFAESDWIFVTGSALVTRTMESLLDQCPAASKVILYGHTAAFFPLALFRHRVHQMRTRVVTDAPRMMELLKNSGPMVERFFPRASREMVIIAAERE